MTDRPVPEQDSKGRFVPGNNGGGGRPRGARGKLGEAFLEALCEDFNQHGVLAIETVRNTKPEHYLKVIASILPKEITGEDGGPIAITRIELVPLSHGDG